MGFLTTPHNAGEFEILLSMEATPVCLMWTLYRCKVFHILFPKPKSMHKSNPRLISKFFCNVASIISCIKVSSTDYFIPKIGENTTDGIPFVFSNQKRDVCVQVLCIYYLASQQYFLGNP